jgi:hypothetical protein
MVASRSTIFFTAENWNAIQKKGNKSKIVNSALKFYFDAKNILKKKEEEFILNELAHYEEIGESYSFEETFS